MMPFWFWRTPAERFWRVFQKYEARARAGKNEAVIKFSNALRRYDRRLAFEWGMNIEGKQELTITAHGRREAFGSVEALFLVKPPLPDWRIDALVRRRGHKISMDYDDLEIRSDEMWFSCTRGIEGLDFAVYFSDIGRDSIIYFQDAARGLLINGLGEYFFGLHVGAIRVAGLPPDPEALGLKPFSDIGSVLALFGEGER